MSFRARRLAAVTAAVLILGGQSLVPPAVVAAVPSECDQVTGNLIVNCGFESDQANWTFAGATGYADVAPSVARTGGYGLTTFPPVSQSVSMSQAVTTTPGAAYEVRFFLRHGGSILDGPSIQVQLTNGGAPTTLLELTTQYYPTWQAFSLGFTAAETSATLAFVFPGYWEIDDISVFEPRSPVVTTHPSSATAIDGSTHVFTVAATGAYVPAVHWEERADAGGAWADVTGATSITLSVAASYGVNGHQYRAVFTNGAGSATSDAATITVVPAAVANLSATFGKGRITVTFTPVGVPAPTHFQCLDLERRGWTACSSGDRVKSSAKSVSVRASWDGSAWGEVATVRVTR